MSDDPNSTPPERRSWFDRLGQMLSGEAQNREDVLDELRTAQSNGLLSADTLRMIEGAIAVSDQQVSDAMLPRAQIVAIDVDAPMDEVIATVIESGHSRFPVHGEDRDDILGILLAKDLLRAYGEGEPPASVRSLLRPATLIPESKRLNVLLKEFRLSRNHMAIVMDEYGGVSGLITIEDVLEQIVGEIDDEHDDTQDDATHIAALAEGEFRVDALTPIDEFNSFFGSDFSDDDYDTIGGLVTDAIGHLPEPGEELSLGKFHFRVASADARRVHAFVLGVATDD
ncbi:MAG: transporter associated domain-containing protein [Xanthomonadaceae bacterium]|nr:transporter associated domain-containing protein [Xanthomonadaceae bacterium]MDP2185758.1 transporter associated domain-containing protein [Xanthomonadales bacterium]MDZ4115042.1 transporter associated domain-containing protein [Xanthomonadaceae bacterium]MDZ4376834.1 transporter associated domain-containing protein [Xanthomonadaceae bacterium]